MRAPSWRDHIKILESLGYPSNFDRKRRGNEIVDSIIDVKASAVATSLIYSSSQLRPFTLSCDPARTNVRCFPIHCQIKGLAAQNFYFIKLRARLWNSTLIENYFYSYDRIDIQSFASIQINDPLIFQTSNENDNAIVITKFYF